MSTIDSDIIMSNTSDNNIDTSISLSETSIDENLNDLMKQDYTYPDPSDPELQKKLYAKREFYYHKIPPRPDVNDYNDIKEYRDNICARSFTLHEHQALLGNFINPDTPYKGVLIYHGLGTGKCISKESLVDVNGFKMKIKEIWNRFKTLIIADPESGEWSIPSESLTVKSINEQGVIISKNVARLFREKINAKVKRITLVDGKRINVTQIHKLLLERGWANDFVVGDSVATYQNNNVIYTMIESIEYVNCDDFVYDLEIEETHNYVAEGILCHNTCAAIAIGEKFKSLVQKYNTKIYVLVSGPLIKENWKNHLLICTGETYLKYQDKSVYIDEVEKAKQHKNALNQALQYYRFMSYRSFYKRVLGEKIVEKKVTKGEKVRVSYRKTEEGEFERDIAVDRLYNLNNSIIIIDEAHNLTGNAYGDALLHIIKNSTNLKVVLLSATPMKNLADDIVELLNFLRPESSPMERDKIFNSNKNHLMDIKPGGLDYFRKMASGYVSHVRGADPLTFARRVDKGIKPKGLIFTKVIQCKMLPFQREIYEKAVRDKDDTLDRRSEAVANFVFPGLSQDRKQIEGYYGREGIVLVKNQLKSNFDLINKKIGTDILKAQGDQDFIYGTEDGKTISGKILKLENLEYFSTKFCKALTKLNRLVWGQKGAKTAFIYSNLVKVGIELFEQVLIQNGYLEFQENQSNYQILPNTVCYYCGKAHKDHEKHVESAQLGGFIESEIAESLDADNNEEDDDALSDPVLESEEGNDSNIVLSTTSKSPIVNDKHNTAPLIVIGNIPPHKFYPATFVSVTGKTSEETAEFIPEDKQRILNTVFNTIENKEGKYIKFVLGSKVMNEGISLRHVSEVHVLDVYFNLGKVDQVVGRAIRHCSHYKLMNEQNKFPLVNVYKYVVTLDNELSTEEELYKKAELKYLLIKKVERAMKEIAIDCPLNVHGNIFPEEVEKFKDCGKPGKEPCPAICDYSSCEYKCNDIKLNAEYYDPQRKIYKRIPKDKLDYSTFTHALARNEIEYAKKRIKEMFMKKYEFTINEIIKYVQNTYDDEKRELFDEFFIFKALDELIPVTENDFNNFKDTILDKFNRAGYLIFRNKYYIFQPFDQNEDVPMYYRTTFDKPIVQKLSLYNYLKNTTQYQAYKGSKKKKSDEAKEEQKEVAVYNFDEVMDYYDNRDEFKYVGIIDKEVSRRKNKQMEEVKDVFKIREKRAKILEKKRGTGIPSIKGAVCATSKNKEYLENIAKELGVEVVGNETRDDICGKIKDKMLLLEKYSRKKEGNKLTYIMVPSNHPEYRFPLNIEDNLTFTISKLKQDINIKLNIEVKTDKVKTGPQKGMSIYKIVIKDDKKLSEYESILKKHNAVKEKNEWIITLE
jgi:hypothetical protein